MQHLNTTSVLKCVFHACQILVKHMITYFSTKAYSVGRCLISMMVGVFQFLQSKVFMSLFSDVIKQIFLLHFFLNGHISYPERSYIPTSLLRFSIFSVPFIIFCCILAILAYSTNFSIFKLCIIFLIEDFSIFFPATAMIFFKSEKQDVF